MNNEQGEKMKNPWEEISLADYENHMKLDSVMQLQAMNKLMEGQFAAYPVSSVAIFGIAGSNGLEHIQRSKFKKSIRHRHKRRIFKRSRPQIPGIGRGFRV